MIELGGQQDGGAQFGRRAIIGDVFSVPATIQPGQERAGKPTVQRLVERLRQSRGEKPDDVG